MPKVILIMDIKNGRDTCHFIMLHFEEVKHIKSSGSMKLLGGCVEYVAASFKCGSFSLMFKESTFYQPCKMITFPDQTSKIFDLLHTNPLLHCWEVL
jgi:hypothetical protein